MTPDEFPLLKICDSVGDGTAPLTAHSVFGYPTLTADPSNRRTIEMRPLPFFRLAG
jgi:hypothetical protein